MDTFDLEKLSAKLGGQLNQVASSVWEINLAGFADGNYTLSILPEVQDCGLYRLSDKGSPTIGFSFRFDSIEYTWLYEVRAAETVRSKIEVVVFKCRCRDSAYAPLRIVSPGTPFMAIIASSPETYDPSKQFI